MLAKTKNVYKEKPQVRKELFALRERLNKVRRFDDMKRLLRDIEGYDFGHFEPRYFLPDHLSRTVKQNAVDFRLSLLMRLERRLDNELPKHLARLNTRCVGESMQTLANRTFGEGLEFQFTIKSGVVGECVDVYSPSTQGFRGYDIFYRVEFGMGERRSATFSYPEKEVIESEDE